jgi:L-fuconolactonase
MSGLADSHLHLFRDGFPGGYGHGPYGLGHEIDAYERFRQAHGIAAGLVVVYEGDEIEEDNNAYVRALAATRPWMSTVAYVEPDAAPDAAAIDALMDQGHVGITLYLRKAQATASARLATLTSGQPQM